VLPFAYLSALPELLVFQYPRKQISRTAAVCALQIFLLISATVVCIGFARLQNPVIEWLTARIKMIGLTVVLAGILAAVAVLTAVIRFLTRRLAPGK
jgi:hypothetical protein